MVFHLVTIFPQFFEGPFDCGVIARARKAGQVEIRFHDLRDHASDRHRTVDDRPFAGDEGMVMKVEPIFRAVEEIRAGSEGKKNRTVVLSAQGRLFDQATAARLAGYDKVTLICGRYEGVDERVNQHLADAEISVGNFVLSGGEWAAGLVLDSVARLLPGVVGNERSTDRESFAPQPEGGLGMLDFPYYTRPSTFRGWVVPPVLLSGNHEEIRRWRKRAALKKTLRNRPDLLQSAALSKEDRLLLREVAEEAL